LSPAILLENESAEEQIRINFQLHITQMSQKWRPFTNHLWSLNLFTI